MAQSFNQPMIAKKLDRQDGTLADTFSLIQCANENIMIDTVKEAEDGGGMIVRLYEHFDRKTRAELTVGVPVKAVYVCDMLENPVVTAGSQFPVPILRSSHSVWFFRNEEDREEYGCSMQR